MSNSLETVHARAQDDHRSEHRKVKIAAVETVYTELTTVGRITDPAYHAIKARGDAEHASARARLS
jgi:hypothetical protein